MTQLGFKKKYKHKTTHFPARLLFKALRFCAVAMTLPAEPISGYEEFYYFLVSPNPRQLHPTYLHPCARMTNMNNKEGNGVCNGWGTGGRAPWRGWNAGIFTTKKIADGNGEKLAWFTLRVGGGVRPRRAPRTWQPRLVRGCQAPRRAALCPPPHAKPSATIF